jgi:curved DNA-binding protein CbpA
VRSDFIKMYRELRIEPGVDLDAFKLAYRRRVALIHPDRFAAKDPISQHLATEYLKRFTAWYEAVLKFHADHGRMPGAPPVRRAQSVNAD